MKILVTIKVSDTQKEQFEKIFKAAQFIYTGSEIEAADEDLAEAEIIIGNIPVKKLGLCKKLKWLQLHNSGADDVALSKNLAKDVILTNATGAYGPVISEHMLGALLMLQKHLNQYFIQQQNQIWKSLDFPLILEGSTVLVWGLGDIGKNFARKVKALGCHVIGIKRRVSEKPDYVDELFFEGSMQIKELLPRADVIAMCMPQTKDTIAILDKEKMLLLKETCILMNFGRGSAIDLDVLAQMMEQKRLAGAVLDVTEPEPFPKEHSLWKCENVLITPHISGNYDVPKTLEKIIEIALKNLTLYSQGKDLINQVDRKTGYRK